MKINPKDFLDQLFSNLGKCRPIMHHNIQIGDPYRITKTQTKCQRLKNVLTHLLRYTSRDQTSYLVYWIGWWSQLFRTSTVTSSSSTGDLRPFKGAYSWYVLVKWGLSIIKQGLEGSYVMDDICLSLTFAHFLFTTPMYPIFTIF